MSAPNDYGQGQVPYQQPYDAQTYQNPAASPPPTAGPPAAEATGAKKKKRNYAAGAFDVGTGGNAAVGGQLPGGGQFGTPQPLQPGYGGYPAQDAQPAPAGYPAPQQPYGSPAPGPQGFAPPDPYGAPPAPGVAGITQGMSNMQMGGGQPAPQQPAAQPRVGPINQLFPTDLLNQPFNVSELDLPPPPMVLPPNVSFLSSPRRVNHG